MKMTHNPKYEAWLKQFLKRVERFQDRWFSEDGPVIVAGVQKSEETGMSEGVKGEDDDRNADFSVEIS